MRQAARVVAIYLFVFWPITILSSPLGKLVPEPLHELTFHLVFYTIAAIALSVGTWRSTLRARSFFGPLPSALTALRTVGLAVPLVGVSVVTFSLTLFVLAFVAPEFASSLVEDSASFLVRDGDDILVWASVLLGLVACIPTPVVEEYAFRGLLLRHWSRSWPVSKAVVVSSVLFGLMHADVFGAAFFAYAACVLYLRSGSLWEPIILHGATNALAVGLSVADELFWRVASDSASSDAPLDAAAILATSPQELAVGAFGLILAAAWAYWFIRRTWQPAAWQAEWDDKIEDGYLFLPNFPGGLASSVDHE